MSDTNKDKFLNHENARTDEQKNLMQKIETDGVCPFCAENFTKYHPKPILKKTNFWFVTENMSPYEGTTTHIIFVYKPKHITLPSEMEEGAVADLFENINWATDKFNIKGGSFFIRFGNTNYNGSSVEHLHAHLLTGVEKNENTEGIKVKLALKNNL